MREPLPEAPPPLADDVLARRDHLPLKPAPIVLTGSYVELRPLDLDGDVAGLHAVSCGAACTVGTRTHGAYDPEALVWRYLSDGPFGDADELRAWLASIDGPQDDRPFTVHDRATDVPIGLVCLIANQPLHLKIEIGNVWFGPIAHGTGAARESTQLLLAHAFGLGYRRVDWKCDARNVASRRAALAYGFTFECVQEQHRISKGRNRDTAWYRMLDSEWLSAKSERARRS
jgi:RimJ/RimL family protein N-acetyltransferase